MVDASPQLVWQLVKNNNCFLKKNQNNAWFSAEPGNLMARNSYKYSGIANNKAVSVRAAPGEKGGVIVTKKNKKGGFSTWAYKKGGAARIAKKVEKEVRDTRPDLALEAKKVAAVAHGAHRRGPRAAEQDGAPGGGGAGKAAGGDTDSDDDMPDLA